MLSDVTVNISHSHMTLYVNIMKHRGFYIRFFPFSQNRPSILSTRHSSTRLYFHEPKDKCPCLNYLPPPKFTVSISLNEKRLIHLDIPYQPFTQCADTLCNTQ